MAVSVCGHVCPYSNLTAFSSFKPSCLAHGSFPLSAQCIASIVLQSWLRPSCTLDTLICSLRTTGLTSVTLATGLGWEFSVSSLSWWEWFGGWPVEAEGSQQQGLKRRCWGSCVFLIWILPGSLLAAALWLSDVKYEACSCLPGPGF